MNLCYVGHDHRANQSALHRAFGRVATCDRHHPDRGDRGLGFGALDAPVAAQAAVQAAPPALGGQRVAKRTPPRPQPPAGLAIVSPEVAAARVAAARAAAVRDGAL